jgi:hypothetical protein
MGNDQLRRLTTDLEVLIGELEQQAATDSGARRALLRISALLWTAHDELVSMSSPRQHVAREGLDVSA